MMNKYESRKRRGSKTKARIKLADKTRLVVFRSTKHIYAQVVYNGEVLVQSSTCDNELKTLVSGKTKLEQATLVGKLLAKRSLAKSIKDVAFDRSGYKFHGRVKALADAAREEGMNF